MEDWVTIAEAAQQIGVAENTLRRYASTFEGFLLAKAYGRTKKYSAEAVQTLSVIAGYYQDGIGTQEITERLNAQHTRTIDIEEHADNPQLPTILPQQAMAAIMAAQQQTLAQVAAAMDKLVSYQEEVSTLRDELQDLKDEQEQDRRERQATEKALKNALDERDQMMVDKMRSMMAERKRDTWWSKLLGK